MLVARDLFPGELEPGRYPIQVRIMARLSPCQFSESDLKQICDLSGWNDDYDKAQGQAGCYDYPLETEGRNAS
jgi:hypothetical protein